MLASDLQELLRLIQAKRFGAMEQLARSLLAKDAEAGMAWKALGIALHAQGKDAVAALLRAVALMPGDAELAASLVEAHMSRGHALMKSGRALEAAGSYEAARQLNPKHAHAHACMGVALQSLGEWEAAVKSFEKALALRPDLIDSQFLLGSCLLTLGRPDEALQSLLRVLELKPDHGPAHANLGNALKALGRLDEALPAYRKASELQPDLALNHANLGAAFRELGQMNRALDAYRRVLELEPQNLGASSDRLFIGNYLSEGTALARKAEAQRFGTLAAARASPFVQWQRHGGERLRVGFVSADLGEHPVGYFAESVMAALAKTHADRIELRVYSNADIEDALAARLRTHCEHWTSIARLDDEAAAALIRADAVDILIDLSGHTAGNRLPLFAWKPAPLQIGWLGYCATTGSSAIDHFIADPWIAPPEADAEFTEKVWRLPDTFLCFTPPDIDVEPGPLPAVARGHITFGCFNKLAKLNDEVIATWARVMQAVPHSELFLKCGPLGTPSGQRQLGDRLHDHGIARERLVMEGASPRDDYLRAYRRVDIALDPFPYPGGTTSVEALWMGVPVLTLAGDRALARQGESILQNVGLPDWIASDADDYVERAARHAGDIEALAELRRRLRRRLVASPLCNAESFAVNFVGALKQLNARR